MDDKTKKLITHNLVNGFNDCEPLDKDWLKRVNDVLDIIRQEAKKEMFDDIEHEFMFVTHYAGVNKGNITIPIKLWEEKKQRHLTVFKHYR